MAIVGVKRFSLQSYTCKPLQSILLENKLHKNFIKILINSS